MSGDTHYAICRIEKIKDMGSIKGASEHQSRKRKTKNADGKRTKSNRQLIGSGRPENDVQSLIDKKQIKLRKNGVIAIDLLLTASPEHFRPKEEGGGEEELLLGMWDKEKVDAFEKRAVAWAKDFFLEENVVSCALHLDETTPHVTALIVPVDDTPRQRGPNVRLNAARWLDGKKKMIAMQDSFYSHVKDIGLKRGIRGSEAAHQKIKQFYGEASKPVPDMPKIQLETPPLRNRDAWAREQEEKITEHIRPQWQTLCAKANLSDTNKRKMAEYQKTAKKKEAENERLREKIANLEKANARLANENLKLAEMMRGIDLELVAQELHLEQIDNVWLNSEKAVQINGEKFYDAENRKGGGGAIDLTMYILNCNFGEAMAFLKSRFGENEATKAIMASAEKIANSFAANHADFEPFPEKEEVEETVDNEEEDLFEGLRSSFGPGV